MAFVSVVAAWLLNTHVSFPWWVDAPSVWAFFGLLYVLFDHQLWKLKALRAIGVVVVPDLNGTWQGSGTSSYDDHKESHQLTLEIRQTWTQLSIVLVSANSRSQSTVGSVLVANGEPVLMYEYVNEPRTNAAETMHTHRGMANLTLHREGGTDVLSGEYYTGRDRRTIGSLQFKRVKNHPRR